MFRRPVSFDPDIIVVRPDERTWGLLIHALGWIPLWGFVFNAAVWLFFKNRSRELIFHVQQAIQFHIIVLLPIIGWSVLTILIQLLSNLRPELASTIQTGVNFALSIFITVCAVVGIGGGIVVRLGYPFLYPLFGRKVLHASIGKLLEE